jgi:hypothetical protein
VIRQFFINQFSRCLAKKKPGRIGVRTRQKGLLYDAYIPMRAIPQLYSPDR